MITEIIHISKRSKQINHGDTTNDTCGGYSPRAIAYLFGNDEPNYPVPATRPIDMDIDAMSFLGFDERDWYAINFVTDYLTHKEMQRHDPWQLL